MSEGVTITIDMVIKPEFAEQVTAGIPAMFADTRRFEGFREIRVVRHRDQPNRLKVIERWDSEAHYQVYIDWRTRKGDMDAAAPTLLSITTDVWPVLIGSAAP